MINLKYIESSVKKTSVMLTKMTQLISEYKEISNELDSTDHSKFESTLERCGLFIGETIPYNSSVFVKSLSKMQNDIIRRIILAASSKDKRLPVEEFVYNLLTNKHSKGQRLLRELIEKYGAEKIILQKEFFKVIYKKYPTSASKAMLETLPAVQGLLSLK